MNNTDDYVTVPFSVFERRREAGRRRVAALFPPGGGWSSVFAAGAPNGLIGVPARNFTGAETSPAEFRLDSPSCSPP